MRARPQAKFLLMAAAAVIAAQGAIVACSPAQWRETQRPVAVAPYTGDPRAERQTTPTRPEDLRPGQPVYTRPDRLCGHRYPQQGKCSEKDPIIEKGDRITVDDPKPKNGKIKCHKDDDPKTPIYVPPQYVSPQPPRYQAEEVRADRFFVIQNVATEKLRLYERCDTRRMCGCKHRLILETDMVVGQDTPARRTHLGSYAVDRWEKFYEDFDKKYLPWYSKDLPANPAPGAEITAWTTGSNRGAFGWYTAMIGPNASEQWLHGTWGWGNSDDSKRFISALRQSPMDQDDKLASHGCTRIDNRAIAMLRELLAPGAKVIKIYAKEAYRDTPAEAASARTGNWRYALTTEIGDRAPHAGLKGVMARRVPEASWLEQGTYQFKSTPTAVPLTQAANTHDSGNVYKIPESSFRGTFLVDEGRVVDYQHPKELTVGGHVGSLPRVILPQACAPQPQQCPTPEAQPEPQGPTEPPPQEPPADEPPQAPPQDDVDPNTVESRF